MCAVTVYSNILHDCKANICTLLSCLFINAVSFIFDDTIVLYSLLIYKTLVCPKKCPYLHYSNVIDRIHLHPSALLLLPPRRSFCSMG